MREGDIGMDRGIILTIDDTPQNADVFANVPRMYGFDDERPGRSLHPAPRGVQLVPMPNWPIRILKCSYRT